MRSRSTYSLNRGFTVLELVVVIAILSVLLGLGLFMSMSSYQGSLHRSERDTIISLLQKARSRAMANVDQTTWGLCIASNRYILFEGAACTPGLATNEELGVSTGATVTGLSSALVFAQLSGTTTARTITITEGNRVSTITTNNEGTIIW